MNPCLAAALRCAALALGATWLAAGMERWINAVGPRARRTLWIVALAPFLTPTLITGYGWSAFSPLRIGSPAALESVYCLLLLARLTPLAIIVLQGASPPPVSPAAWHAWRLLRTTDFASKHGMSIDVPLGRMRRRCGWTTLVLILGGPAWRLAPAFAVVFLVGFQDFELAGLLQTGFGLARAPLTWTVPLFDLQAGGWPLADSLGRGVAPLVFQLLSAWPVVALWTGFRGTRSEEAPAVEPLSRVARLGLAAWLAVALVMTLVAPFGTIVWNASPAINASLRDPRFLRELAATTGYAAVSTAAAMFAARRLVGAASWSDETAPPSSRRRSWGRSLLRAAALAPGFVGTLLLGLSLAALFQTRPLTFVAETPLPLAIGLTLFLLPRAALLLVLRDALLPTSAWHAARLLTRSPDANRIRRARDLAWRLKGRHDFAATAIIAWTAWWEMTLPSLLAPVSTPVVAPSLYNQMHFGQSAVLCGRALVATAAPLLVGLLVGGGWRLFCLRFDNGLEFSVRSGDDGSR